MTITDAIDTVNREAAADHHARVCKCRGFDYSKGHSNPREPYGCARLRFTAPPQITGWNVDAAHRVAALVKGAFA